MSFFGFDQPIDLEGEKRRFLEGAGAEKEDIAVYTWGEESYDGLGNELQERGDELNDETFDGMGDIGKDFDFTQTALLQDGVAKPQQQQQQQQGLLREPEQPPVAPAPPPAAQASNTPSRSAQSLWEDKSPFSVLPRMNGTSRAADHAVSHTPVQPSRLGPQTDALLSQQTAALSLGGNMHKGVRTMEEVEAEMRAAAAAAQQQQQQQFISHSHSSSQSQLRGQIPRQGTPQHAATPPPRMHPHAQSPRFHQQQQQQQIYQLQMQQRQQQEQQRQLIELQEQRERQQHQMQLLQLQEQLRLEELERERQLRLQQNHLQAQLIHSRHSPALSDRQRRASPARSGMGTDMGMGLNAGIGLEVPFQHSMPYLPQDIQTQQRMLAQMAQAEFLSSMQGGGPPTEREVHEQHEQLRAEAMRKIMEAERMEEKRKRKQAKIHHMSRYNDLMTQSDKDFITRIQVSQLVTQDPYTDDYYAQVYGQILRTRMGVQSQDDRVLKFGSSGGVGLGLGQKVSGRRQSAMQRMEAQVERIVNNTRLREKEKISLNNLQGALGKTSGRSYKAAPRQLLQVEAGSTPSSPASSHAHISKTDVTQHQSGEGATKEAAKIAREALGSAADADADSSLRRDPLTHREALILLERLYDIVLELEQMRQEQPPAEEGEAFLAWQHKCDELVDKLWTGLGVTVYLETSVPHPFISLLNPLKGKRLLHRVQKFLSPRRMLTLVSLLIVCLSQLDVVTQAHLLDTLQESEEHAELEVQTQAFQTSVIKSILPIIAKSSLREVRGLLALLVTHNNIVAISRTSPCIALLMTLLSRVDIIKEDMPLATDISELPSKEDTDGWQIEFDTLFERLAPHFVLMFPSVRISARTGIPYTNVPYADVMDNQVWQFMAELAMQASTEQQQIMVTQLREIVLENVTSVHKGWVADEEEQKARLANVNLFLRALGLDSSQITV